MDWEPAHADHSIDRVVVTFNWHEPIEANTFDELLVAGRKAAVNYHLTHRIDIQDAVVLPPATGNMVTINSVATFLLALWLSGVWIRQAHQLRKF